ncbi:MAG: protein translocase subunit SecF [Thermodesulfobacteriota bacterium]|nr:protein translocase subunit SecF [Thermodesulfobacteriota bacterium]
MELIKSDINIDFVGKIKMCIVISLIAILIGFISLIMNNGFKYGIDFSGGTLVQVKFAEAVKISAIRDALLTLDSENAVIQRFGRIENNEFIIRIKTSSTDLRGLSEQMSTELTEGIGNLEIRRVEMVGPKVGKDLRRKATYAIFFAFLGILAYISFRFDYRFGIGAIIAIIHDVTITLGAISITGIELDLPVIAALLTIVGYSINDTIIIYDRVRENQRRFPKEKFHIVVNKSINQTLSRTILTSGTVIFVLVALYILGGEILKNFAFILLIGVIAGTYSSMYIASPVVIFWSDVFVKKRKKRR